ncbi:leucine-rich repeat domain-containing protein [Domibacillus sp. PGB-M46]|uniref:leucine-rich repeat domain-containing protein n=1 Tax=Domibacillus sp. PGB-M46 TaxID=2910255 RepID=UPI001F577876|nr:leucine-rich repeat domain-containing protein [Domibacillus sp. PGB-M46]MCI2256138.1 leucine-rich repeat domain-containing protein [Domibacillus sp. PGB-M46]
MKQKIVFFICIFLMSYYLPYVSSEVRAEELKTTEFENSAGIVTDKVWTVTFNSFLDPDSVNSTTVYVEDENKIKIDTEVSLGDSENQIVVQPPTGGYIPSNIYTLHIKNVKNSKGRTLPTPVTKTFMVAGERIANIEESPDINKIALNSILESSGLIATNPGENGGTLELKENTLVQSGDVITIEPNEEYPEGLARKVENVEEKNGKLIVTTSVPYLEDMVDLFEFTDSIPVTSEFIEKDSLPKQITVKDFTRQSQASGDPVSGLEYSFNDFPITLEGQLLFLNGSIELQNPILNPDFKMDFTGINKDNFSFTLETTVVSKLTLELEGGGAIPVKTFEEISLPMGKLKVPIPQLPGLTLDGSISTVVIVGGIGSVNATMANTAKVEVGVIKDNNDIKPIHSFETEKIDFSTKGSFTLELKYGIRASLSASYLLVKFASLSNDFGVYSNASAITGSVYSNLDEEMTNLGWCAAGETGFFDDFYFKLQWDKLTIWKKNIAGFKLKLFELNNCNFLQSLAFEADTMEIESGETKKTQVFADIFNLTKSASDRRDVTRDVTFSSSDEDVTVSPIGEIRVKPGLNNKKATIEATYKYGDITKSASLAIHVLEKDSPIVTFPDPNLEALIREKLSKPTGDITKEDMLEIEELEARYADITDLKGLEFAKNLKILDLYHSGPLDISALASLHNLKELYLSRNQISDISALAGLTNLTNLDLRENLISNVEALANLKNLTELDLFGNYVADLNPLASLTNLTDLTLFGPQIKNIDALANLTNLQSLTLVHSQVTNTNSLKNLKKIEQLLLNRNQISDINALEGLWNLKYLYLEQNPLDQTALEIINDLKERGVIVFY